MLTDEDRARIDADERLRHAVRQSMQPPAGPLEPPPPPAKPRFGQRLMHFLNSSVGMWLLSSVLLTGGAAVLQQIQHDHEISLKNQQDLTTLRWLIRRRCGRRSSSGVRILVRSRNSTSTSVSARRRARPSTSCR